MYTRNWLLLIHNMGYNPNSNTFVRPVNVIGFEWRPDMVNYNMTMVNERRYTSRVHDLLDIVRLDPNSEPDPEERLQLHLQIIIARKLLLNLIGSADKKMLLGKLFCIKLFKTLIL